MSGAMDSSTPSQTERPALAEAKAPRRGGMARRWAWLLLALALLACATAWWRIVVLDRQLRSAQNALAANELRNAERDRRLAALERQFSVNAAEDDASAALMDPALKARRDALALGDIERLLDQAQVQWRLGVAPSAVIDVLDYARKRLALIGTPRAARLQQAVQADLGRLRAAPEIDRFALAARVDGLLQQLEQWRVLSDAQHAAQGPLAVASAGPRPRDDRAASPVAAAAPWAERWRAWISAEFGDLIRIQSVKTPEALQLGIPQQQLLRDRLRFALMNLRQSLVVRDHGAVRAEASTAESLLVQYFDRADPAVATALAEVRAVASAATQAGDVGLTDIASALRAPAP